MTVPGRGGLPPRRPDQVYAPPAPGAGAGTSNIVRARLVIISGPGNALLVYNGTPASGNLVIAIAAQAGGDLFGNSWLAGITIGDLLTFTNYTWLDEFGQIFLFHNGTDTITLDPLTGTVTITAPAFVKFPSGAAFENTVAMIAAGEGGVSPAQYVSMEITSASTTTAGARDTVGLSFNSAAADNSSSANMDFIYTGSNGTAHEYAFMDMTGFNILAGSIAAVDPGSSPAVPAAWRTITLQNGYTAGANNGFTDVPQVRLMADNKTLQFKGRLVCPASPSSNVWGLLPASFPNANLGGPFGLGVVANTTGGVSDHVQVQNNANLSLLNGTGHGGDTFDLCCVVPTQ